MSINRLTQLKGSMSDKDWLTFHHYSRGRKPDEIFDGSGEPYLYRWYVVPKNPNANVYFHLQASSDPDRPLHDHPWDSMSVILAGGYDEVRYNTDTDLEYIVPAREGDVIVRNAAAHHRLILPEGIPYTMTQFATGPKVRDWGFHTPDGWVRWDQYIKESRP